jgi:hypothetical protein
MVIKGDSMMDCSKTEVFFAELRRMCTFLGEEKQKCPLKKPGQSCGYTCFMRIIQNPAEAIKAVQEWSNTHPVKTRLSVLKEQYPNIVLNPDNGIPYDICAGVLYGFEDCDDEGNYDCEKCWNTPIEGVQ